MPCSCKVCSIHKIAIILFLAERMKTITGKNELVIPAIAIIAMIEVFPITEFSGTKALPYFSCQKGKILAIRSASPLVSTQLFIAITFTLVLAFNFFYYAFWKIAEVSCCHREFRFWVYCD